ncbi:MAG: universal stress protein [Alphaproteobacteria bacterium]|nr:universal stress protein [Alphaproteobacteria bacterium]
MKSFLLATDLCANSDRAMGRALKLAKEHDAKLHILHVLPEKNKEPGCLQERAAEIETLIKSYIGDYKGTQELNVNIDIIRSAKTYDVICGHAARIKAELIIMGMHRKARFMDVFMSTTFARVLQECSVPVLMVKEKPVAPYQSVLCGNDFASGFYKAFDAAVAIAPDAHFEVMHACEKTILCTTAQCSGCAVDSKGDCAEKLESFITDQKHQYNAKYGDFELDIECFVVEADPYYTLIEHTQKEKVELICVGTHGHETCKIGPVTNSLMADPPCDILVAGAGC